MRSNLSFWDTSAIIPMFCNQVISPESRRLRRQFSEFIVWWGTHVEVYSAIYRLFREGVINGTQLQASLERWNSFYSLARTIGPDDQVLAIAASLPMKYDIRALDAFQLAAALVWCHERPRNRPFVCADTRLSEAASDAGFDVIGL